MKAFRELGYSVLDLSAVGRGCPDLAVAIDGRNYLIEVKYKKGALNDKQKEFMDNWRAIIYVIRTEAEVKAFHQNK